MIVLTLCDDEILFVPTCTITISKLFKFIAPEDTSSVNRPTVAPGKACVVQPLMLSTYLGIEAEIIVALFSRKIPITIKLDTFQNVCFHLLSDSYFIF